MTTTLSLTAAAQKRFERPSLRRRAARQIVAARSTVSLSAITHFSSRRIRVTTNATEIEPTLTGDGSLGEEANTGITREVEILTVKVGEKVSAVPIFETRIIIITDTMVVVAVEGITTDTDRSRTFGEAFQTVVGTITIIEKIFDRAIVDKMFISSCVAFKNIFPHSDVLTIFCLFNLHVLMINLCFVEPCLSEIPPCSVMHNY